MLEMKNDCWLYKALFTLLQIFCIIYFYKNNYNKNQKYRYPPLGGKNVHLKSYKPQRKIFTNKFIKTTVALFVHSIQYTLRCDV